MGQGTPSPEPPATPAQPDPDKDYVTRIWRGAHAEGREKGQAEGRAAFLKELGLPDEASLRQRLGLQAPAGQATTPPPGQGGEWERLALQLQAEGAEREKQAAQLAEQVARYQAQDARALRAELVAELVKAGAHAAGAEDLARQLVPAPDGPEVKVVRSSDGQGLVVMERTGPDGQYVPSKHPWSKYVESLKKDRAHFWPATLAEGSGGGNGPAPGGAAPHGLGWNFYANLEALNRQRQR